MENYQGITDTDKLINGGKYVDDYKVGGEIYNFKNFNGFCYGYVQPVSKKDNISGGTININELGAHSSDEFITGVDVILTAYRPKSKTHKSGTVVVGWYKNATVYRNKQKGHPKRFYDIQKQLFGYRFKTEFHNATLLPEDERNLFVPIAGGLNGIKGGLGQSNVWYALNSNKSELISQFKEDVISILYSTSLKQDEIVKDLEEINRSNSKDTEKEMLSKARIGQGQFRKDVIRIWGIGERCAVTGIDLPQLLIASHIKPWRSSENLERLDPTNGILLATHLDMLFDNYLISFKKVDRKYQLVCNPLVVSTLTKMGVKSDVFLNITRLKPEQISRLAIYLEEHIAHFLDKL
jgi:hypothetical protein